MLRAEPDFDDVAPTEADTLSLNFRRLLAVGETIVSAAWQLEVVRTDPGAVRDTAPQTRLAGSAFVPDDQPTLSAQVIGPGCVPGNRYMAVCTATTSLNNQKVLFCFITCRNPGAPA